MNDAAHTDVFGDATRDAADVNSDWTLRGSEDGTRFSRDSWVPLGTSPAALSRLGLHPPPTPSPHRLSNNRQERSPSPNREHCLTLSFYFAHQTSSLCNGHKIWTFSNVAKRTAFFDAQLCGHKCSPMHRSDPIPPLKTTRRILYHRRTLCLALSMMKIMKSMLPRGQTSVRTRVCPTTKLTTWDSQELTTDASHGSWRPDTPGAAYRRERATRTWHPPHLIRGSVSVERKS